MPKSQEALVANMAGSGFRYDTLEGRQHIVVPVVMITRGVHNGSAGPLLYRDEDLQASVAAWNMRPVVVYHPQAPDGSGKSALDPLVANTQKIGVLLNTKYEDGKLKAEAWLEEDRVRFVDSRVLDAIVANKVMEVSTGLFTQAIPSEGVSDDGKTYSFIATNYQPDHLAVLPDQVGACSIEDGAGLLRLNQLVSNALSHSDLRTQLRTAVDSKYPERIVYIEDVFDNYVIIEIGGSLFKLSYTKTGDSVTLASTPGTPVARKISYPVVTNKQPDEGDEPTRNESEPNMGKAEKIKALIANKATQWTEDDKETLEAFDEEVLDRLVPVENKEPDDKEKETATAEPDTTETADDKEKETATATAVANADDSAPAITQEQFDEMLAKDEAFCEMRAVYNSRRTELIQTILNNKRNVFTEEQLKAKSVSELNGLAALAGDGNPQTGKVGVANALQNAQSFHLQNGVGPQLEPEITETPLESPTMEFSAAE